MIDSTTVEMRPASDDVRERNAQRFKALGDPTRLGIVQILAGGCRCVCEIQAELDVSSPLLSHHLKVLREAGLIVAERRGRWIDYRLDDDGCAALASVLPGSARAISDAACACACNSRRASAPA